MNITTARDALSSAAPAMMPLDISRVANVERSSATLDGRANTAQNVSYLLCLSGRLELCFQTLLLIELYIPPLFAGLVFFS